jgi:hypothetical protein
MVPLNAEFGSALAASCPSPDAVEASLEDPLEAFWSEFPWSRFAPHAYAAIAAKPITNATLGLRLAASFGIERACRTRTTTSISRAESRSKRAELAFGRRRDKK